MTTLAHTLAKPFIAVFAGVVTVVLVGYAAWVEWRSQ